MPAYADDIEIQKPSLKIKVDPHKYLHIAEIVARRFVGKKELSVKDSDVYGEACLALVKIANEGYDPKLGEFSTLAYTAVANSLKSYIRKSKRKKRTAIFETIESDIVEQPKSTKETIPIALLDDFLEIKVSDSDQDKIDKNLLKAIFIEKKKVSKLAQSYGVSRVTIYSWIDRVIKKIRQENPELLKRYGNIA